jgi:hypothetical protein
MALYLQRYLAGSVYVIMPWTLYIFTDLEPFSIADYNKQFIDYIISVLPQHDLA